MKIRYADYGYSSGGALTWYVNGANLAAAQGQNTITVPAPALGKPLAIEARLDTALGVPRIAKTTIVTSTIDLIVESDTHVPYFYEGRRVPSVGSRVRIIGVPHIFNQKGQRVAQSDLVYSWNINNELRRGNRGDVVLDTTLSSIGDSTVTLSVEATDASAHYETSFDIPLASPAVEFYTLNPLTGLSRNAIQDKYLDAKDEVTVRAEPYFVSADVYQNAQYGWTIDQNAVANQSTDPALITLKKTGEAAISEIGFSIRNLRALSQYAANLFQLAFK